VLDVSDGAVSHWLAEHALFTSAIVSVLVLLITVLNVDRVARRRQVRDRSRVIAAQAVIVNRQGRRATALARAALDDADQREAASDELRTYMTMLLISAPVLIDAAAARTFLEAAQRLAWLLSVALQRAADGHAHDLDDKLDQAAGAVSDAAEPLVSILNLAQLTAIDSGDGAGGDGTTAPGSASR
jgi:hypothetical protein